MCHLPGDGGQLAFCAFDDLDEMAVVVLESLGSLETAGQLPMVVSGTIQLGVAGQLDYPALVFGNGSVEPLQAGINPNDLTVTSG